MALLVIESSEKTIRAAVVKKTLKGDFKIRNLVKINRSDEYEILTENEIRTIKMMIENCPENVVIANNSVMLMEVFMNKQSVKKMNKTQLKQAIKWEVEQYVQDNIVGYEVCEVSKKDNKSDVDSKIWVSMIPKDDYTSLEDRLLKEGLKLKNIYPVETCFPLVKNRGDSKSGIISVNVSDRNIKMTYIKNKKVLNFMDIPIGSDDILFNIGNRTIDEIKEVVAGAFNQMSLKDNLFEQQISSNIKFISRNENIEEEFVILSGVGANDKRVVNFFTNAVPLYIEVADVNIDIELLEEDVVATEFVSVLGASMRQLSLNPSIRNIGVNNNPTLMAIIKNNPDTAVGVAVIAIALILSASYLFMRLNIHTNSKKITELKNVKTEYENLQAEGTRISDEKKSTMDKIEEDNEKIIFLSKEIDSRRETIVDLLQGIRMSSNIDVSIDNIEPIDTNIGEFILQGKSDSLASVDNLITGIQAQPWCSHVRVLSIGKTSPPKQNVEEIVNEIEGEIPEPTEIKVEPEITFYNFDMRIVFN